MRGCGGQPRREYQYKGLCRKKQPLFLHLAFTKSGGRAIMKQTAGGPPDPSLQGPGAECKMQSAKCKVQNEASGIRHQASGFAAAHIQCATVLRLQRGAGDNRSYIREHREARKNSYKNRVKIGRTNVLPGRDVGTLVQPISGLFFRKNAGRRAAHPQNG